VTSEPPPELTRPPSRQPPRLPTGLGRGRLPPTDPPTTTASRGRRRRDRRRADALYREAHHLHFVRRDFGAALAAWDRYLAMGTGALSIEARYNPAIALALSAARPRPSPRCPVRRR